MADVPGSLRLDLPEWTPAFVAEASGSFPDADARMTFVIELAREHVERGTGGPFSAAVFERDSGRLVSVGLNLVVESHVCVAHAEVLALGLAGRRTGTYDLGANVAMELVTSTEPCTMCLGATMWSGVRRMVCGGRDEDARAIGFDEGPKPDDWVAALTERDIDVVRDVRRAEVQAVLHRYVELGGPVYNASTGGAAG
jgi:tRNA(Arg) A34 adenosine deaminase TadA